MSGGVDFIFFLNVVSHVLILWTALTVLFWLVIGKKESKVLTDEFVGQIEGNLVPALNTADETSGGALKESLLPTREVFVFMSEQYTGSDPATDTFNTMLLGQAVLIGVVVLAIVATSLGIGKRLCGYEGLGRKYGFVVLENLFLFVFIGAVEYVFFQQVASRYVPVKPDVIVTRVIEDVKKAFATS